MAMATATTPIVSISVPGGSHLKGHELQSTKCNSFGNTLRFPYQRKSNQPQTNRKLSVRAEYKDRRGEGGDFVAGFLLGGAVFGTLAYIYAPQIRRLLLNEDEYGFRRPRGPIYYDEDESGLEKTRHALNAKIRQLNSAINNVSSRLRGGNNMPPIPTEIDPEEATM
ncbi:Dynein heavy chain like [Actinidia chinensis var. chinensis]|uniref:Dynein heavy chain like n=1 Tax=Actinidia chinensis var. chinensis TaxID=1590841 RepID=A0A2R6QPM0_ACTCC|nr:Dynein heavy chain like [Actinidia chinensis var. chinensis]